MGALRILYDDIYTKLGESTIIQTVEDYNQDYLDMENRRNIKFPAVFIETNRVYWDQNSNDCYTLAQPPQTGTASISLHIVNQSLKDHNSAYRAEIFELTEHVTSLIHRLKASDNDAGTYTTLLRTEEVYETPTKQLTTAIVTFQTKLTDSFQIPDYQLTTGVTATITASII